MYCFSTSLSNNYLVILMVKSTLTSSYSCWYTFLFSSTIHDNNLFLLFHFIFGLVPRLLILSQACVTLWCRYSSIWKPFTIIKNHFQALTLLPSLTQAVPLKISSSSVSNPLGPLESTYLRWKWVGIPIVLSILWIGLRFSQPTICAIRVRNGLYTS